MRPTMPPVNAATREMNKIRPNPVPAWSRRALGEQERGAQVHRQHLIELGGGDVLQRLEMAQPVVADQHSTSTRAQRFGGRLDELTGACGRRRSAPIAGAVPPAEVISAASAWAAWPWAL
jgi:hypothetical protein